MDLLSRSVYRPVNGQNYGSPLSYQCVINGRIATESQKQSATAQRSVQPVCQLRLFSIHEYRRGGDCHDNAVAESSFATFKSGAPNERYTRLRKKPKGRYLIL
jgi:hypothetical protein